MLVSETYAYQIFEYLLICVLGGKGSWDYLGQNPLPFYSLRLEYVQNELAIVEQKRGVHHSDEIVHQILVVDVSEELD